MENQLKIEELDREWVYLIMAARQLEISPEEIRSFLRKPAHVEQQVPISTKA